MSFSVFLHLIFTGLVGIHCKIQTMSKVPVKAGGSITIPCLYENQDRDDVKYLCKGENWRSCKKVIDTKQTTTGRYDIVDDTKQNIFTVTIHKVTDDNERFWCAVEKQWSDVKQEFELSVKSDSASLSVKQQDITAFERGSVTVICHYKDEKVIKWCRLGSTCVTRQLEKIDGTTVKLNSSVYGIFNVTMSDLRTESSGWYYCASKNRQIPVNITVSKSHTTTTVSTTTTPSLNTARYTESHTVFLINSTVNETNGVNLQGEHKSFTMVMILVSTLLLQLLIVIAAVIGWRMIKRKKIISNGNDISMEPQTPADSEIFYSTVVHNQTRPIQQEQIPTGSAIYSNINTYANVDQMTAAREESVIYSTLK